MSSSYLIPSLGPEKSQYLWESIKAKLASLNLYTDDVLSEYIMVLLQGGNSREKIYEELVIFMNSPEIAEHFVLWLFGEIENLIDSTMNNNVHSINTSTTTTSSSNTAVNTINNTDYTINNINSINPVNPVDSTTTTATNNTHINDVQMGSNNNSGPRIQGTRNFSKAIESAVSKSNTSRTFSSNEESSNNRRNLKTSPGRRVVRSSDAEKGGKVQKIKVSVDFDRDEKQQQRMRSSKRAAFKKLNVVSDEADEENSSDSPKIKVKCPYWPNCRAGDACPNVHPTETCKHFPNCQFGDACTFLHPSIPCKFQEKCQNPLCNYQHRPTIAAMAGGFYGAGPAGMAASSSATSTILCKFYPRCVNATCPYLHPVKTPCRYGVDCSRPDCPFEHPGGRKGAHLKSVVFAPCKYGKQCARADCPYQHDRSADEMNIVELTNDTSNNNTNTNNNINEQMMQ